MGLVREVLFDPGTALQRAKSEHNMTTPLILVLLSSLIATIAVFMNLMPVLEISQEGDIGLITAIMVFFVTAISILFMGYLVKITATTLTGKGGYFEGLTAMAFSGFLSSVGALILAIIIFIGGFLGTALDEFLITGAFLFIGTLVFVVFIALSFAVMFRAIKELFETNYTVALITAICVYLSLMLLVTVFLIVPLLAIMQIFTMMMGMSTAIGPTMPMT